MCGGILESTSPRFSQRADFFTYICFLCLVILLSNAFITGGERFASILALSLLKTVTIDN
ncbi:hypothetical protein NA56DRAFT_715688 [Hyaloscypha hepaticicola]|uniref:Uncharacterized protein n=1 Tax=Hyaloscypha hepaticicola TaxID=2082293 RepID=A0A2J6PDK7_9HELO|nr:hypothetical protein NA56DRAFT_715688 [Hyaloscypha hepaticicola]